MYVISSSNFSPNAALLINAVSSHEQLDNSLVRSKENVISAPRINE